VNVFIDTHALIWSADNSARLSNVAADYLGNTTNALWISSGTLWELGIKVGLGKLILSYRLSEWINLVITGLQAQLLPITVEHVALQAELPFHHRDPFDRLLVAQALYENYAIISSDAMLDSYGVRRIW